jgi:hypothetical protein
MLVVQLLQLLPPLLPVILPSTPLMYIATLKAPA